VLIIGAVLKGIEEAWTERRHDAPTAMPQHGDQRMGRATLRRILP